MKSKTLRWRVILLSWFLLILPANALTQVRQIFNIDEFTGVRIDSLKQWLNLTNGQAAKIDTILRTHVALMMKEREAKKDDRKEIHKAMQAQTEKMHQEILAVLTLEQKLKYREILMMRQTETEQKKKEKQKAKKKEKIDSQEQ